MMRERLGKFGFDGCGDFRAIAEATQDEMFSEAWPLLYTSLLCQRRRRAKQALKCGALTARGTASRCAMSSRSGARTWSSNHITQGGGGRHSDGHPSTPPMRLCLVLIKPARTALQLLLRLVHLSSLHASAFAFTVGSGPLSASVDVHCVRSYHGQVPRRLTVKQRWRAACAWSAKHVSHNNNKGTAPWYHVKVRGVLGPKEGDLGEMMREEGRTGIEGRFKARRRHCERHGSRPGVKGAAGL